MPAFGDLSCAGVLNRRLTETGLDMVFTLRKLAFVHLLKLSLLNPHQVQDDCQFLIRPPRPNDWADALGIRLSQVAFAVTSITPEEADWHTMAGYQRQLLLFVGPTGIADSMPVSMVWQLELVPLSQPVYATAQVLHTWSMTTNVGQLRELVVLLHDSTRSWRKSQRKSAVTGE